MSADKPFNMYDLNLTVTQYGRGILVEALSDALTTANNPAAIEALSAILRDVQSAQPKAHNRLHEGPFAGQSDGAIISHLFDLGPK